MAYVGGKSKCAGHILKVLNDPKYDNRVYIEPFVGYCHILRRVVNKKKYIVSDFNPLLVELLKGLLENKEYPVITRERYNELKADKVITFERAIAAFCYSYNGKEWGGYVDSSKCGSRTSYSDERKRYYDKLKLCNSFIHSKISRKDYKTLNPKGALIYCDPPYFNTTRYSPEFNHDEFWEIIRKWSVDNDVFVSEYSAPPDFECVAQENKKSSLSGKGASSERVEKLFTIKNKINY